jgi:hypothetical protein
VIVLLEWGSTLLSFAGTALIAHHAREGWWLCFWADAGFIVFALRKRMWGFFSLCLGYAVLNLMGALSW